MNQNVLIAIIALVAVVVVLGIWLTMRRQHTDSLREKFGDEYDRTLDTAPDRSAAEKALEERQKRVEALEIRALTSDESTRFADEWREVKAVFVDSPTEAVLHADRMLATMMKTVGYPMADFDRRFEDLTVNHGDVARHYRAAHEIAERHNSGGASTEDMRQAMKHYEALYDHLSTGTAAGGSDGDGRVETAARDRDTEGRTDAAFKTSDVDRDADIIKQDTGGNGSADRYQIKAD